MIKHERMILETKPTRMIHATKHTIMQPNIQDCNQTYNNDTCKWHNQHVTSHTLTKIHSTITTSTSSWWNHRNHDQHYANAISTWNASVRDTHETDMHAWQTHNPSSLRGETCFDTTYVTPFSHIYPSNHPTGLNMWGEAAVIGFNLLCDLKEMEST